MMWQVVSKLLTIGITVCISVGAQSTLGEQDIFARKYMHEKLTKIPEFYMIYARKN